MRLSHVFIALAVALVLAIGWRYRASAQELLAPQPVARPAPFKFDNGSIRDAERASAPDTGAPPVAVAVPGGMRKCVRAATVLYTDKTCPPGSREQVVRADKVTVLPGTQPAAVRPGGPEAPPRKPLLRELAGPDDSAALREQAIDRATRP